MRLINVNTKKLEIFFNKIPPYAILSHTWKDGEELLLRDVEAGRLDKPGIGSFKFRKCCEQAKEDGFDYIWIDTCCIDKSDSVELGEAINSMFRWYKESQICYAFLLDVNPGDIHNQPNSQLRGSRWFKRGWTLQELLAPPRLQFYNADWQSMGTKRELCVIIEDITKISRHFLLGIADLHSASVAQRMSWAAKRETTRKEDQAYCLLGLFYVSIPMIYGEGGELAFFRLQDEIMKSTRDNSILAWGFKDMNQAGRNYDNKESARALAVAPSYFAGCENVAPIKQAESFAYSLRLSEGLLRVSMPIFVDNNGKLFGLLQCGLVNKPTEVVGIPLQMQAGSSSSEIYLRARNGLPVLIPLPGSDNPSKTFFISNEDQNRVRIPLNRYYWIYGDEVSRRHVTLIDVAPASCWNKQKEWIETALESEAGHSGQIFARFRHKMATTASGLPSNEQNALPDFVILLEIHVTGPQCHVMTCSRNTTLEDLRHNFLDMASELSGKTSVSNSALNLHISVDYEAVQRLCHIRMDDRDAPVHFNDATLELEKLEILNQLVQDVKERMTIEEKNKEVEQKWLEESEKLQIMKEELLLLESQVSRLKQEIGEKTKMLQKMTTDGRDLESSHEKTWAYLQDAARKWTAITKSHVFKDQNAAEDTVSSLLLRLENDRNIRLPDLLTWAIEHRNRSMTRQLSQILAVDSVLIGRGRDETALCYAVWKGFDDIAGVLLDGGAEINRLNQHEWNPLGIAAATGNLKLVQLLLSRGADVKQGRKTMSPLGFACGGRKLIAHLVKGGWFKSQLVVPEKPLDIVSAGPQPQLQRQELHNDERRQLATTDDSMLAHHPTSSQAGIETIDDSHRDRERRLDESSLADTVYPSSPNHVRGENIEPNVTKAKEISRQLDGLEKNDENIPSLTSASDEVLRDDPNISPSIEPHEILSLCASNSERSEIVKVLLDSGADITGKLSDGWIPLIFAARYGHADVVNVLLSRGADINASTDEGFTPLHCAADSGHVDIVNLLLSRGADINASTDKGFTPLHFAGKPGHINIANLLLSRGAHIQTSDNYVFAPIHAAACSGSLDIVRLFLSRGASISARDHDGDTALQDAAESGHVDVVKFLHHNGADIATVNNKGQTALHYAALRGHLSVVDYLLHQGLDSFALDKQNQSAVSLAESGNHQDVTDLLTKWSNKQQEVQKTPRPRPKSVSTRSHESGVIPPYRMESLSAKVSGPKSPTSTERPREAPPRQGSTVTKGGGHIRLSLRDRLLKRR